MKVQLERLFGANHTEATREFRTDAQWRATLKRVLRELYQYKLKNVESDNLHQEKIETCFESANEALLSKEFYVGYIEALTRLCLILMGDYPDHRNRKGSGMREDHYSLTAERNVFYTSTGGQRLYCLAAAHSFGLPGCVVNPYEEISNWRRDVGNEANLGDFPRWFSVKYPEHYSATF